MIAWSSLLFVPADNADRLAKAHTRGADALILDLEDGVAAADKPSARLNAARAIADLAARGAVVLVRINSEPSAVAEDLAAIVRPGLSALMIPKAEGAAQLAALSDAVGRLERERGLPEGQIGLLPLLETAAAFEHLWAIAAAERVVGLALGTEDFALSLGVSPGPESLDLPCRMIAMAAAAKGVASFGAPVSIARLDQPEAFAAGLERACQMGLRGALCVHPAQVAAVNACFAPTAAEIAHAEAVVEAWAAAGRGGVMVVGGQMVDEPVAVRAERLLAKVSGVRA